MKTKATKGESETVPKSSRASRVETAAATGAVAGAAAGALAGPIGIAAGAIVGGAAGAVTGLALADDAERRHAHQEELDEDIGVMGGEIGAADPKAPPARIGAYSSGSAGLGGQRESQPSEGPMQDVDD